MRNFRYLIFLPVLLLVGCGSSPEAAPNSASVVSEEAGSAAPKTADDDKKNAENAKPAPAVPRPWTDVQDGTWDYGDVELGQPVTQRLSDYEITIDGVPELTTVDGEKVLMAAKLSVKRIGDRGFGEGITASEKVFFTPGNLNYPEHDEVYGVNPKFSCEKEQISEGQRTTCTVSFEAPATEIQDSHWVINGRNAAAWPGQKAAD